MEVLYIPNKCTPSRNGITVLKGIDLKPGENNIPDELAEFEPFKEMVEQGAIEIKSKPKNQKRRLGESTTPELPPTD
jgi:hypothetical protein